MSHLQTPNYRKENTPVSYWKHKNIYFLGFPCLDDCVFVCWCVYKVIHLEKLLHTFVQMWTKWNLKFNSSLVFRTWTLIQEAGSAKTLSFLSLTLHLCNGELWKCNLITFTADSPFTSLWSVIYQADQWMIIGHYDGQMLDLRVNISVKMDSWNDFLNQTSLTKQLLKVTSVI